MLSRTGQLFTGGPSEGILQKASPPTRLIALLLLTAIAAFTSNPILLAGLLSTALILATVSYLDLPSILRITALPLILLALPSWLIAAIFLDLPWSVAARGVLRVATSTAIAIILLHSIGLMNIASTLRRLGVPAELCTACRIMIAQATTFSDVTTEMELARNSRIITQPPSGKIRHLIGGQMGVLFARMLQRSHDLVLATDAREIIPGHATEPKATPDASSPTAEPPHPPSSSPKPLFQLRNITHEFTPGEPALAQIFAEIHTGRCTAILGCNAAGKSTLLHMLAGLLTPTHGDLQWHGNTVSAAILNQNQTLRSDFRRRVGIVFQDPDTQWLCETVQEEVEFGPRQIWPHIEASERAAQVMVTMGVNHLAARAPFTLSGGEKRRVALASVMALSPDVLLLDEPTLSLDAATTDFLLDWLHEYLAHPGKTLILASHDLQLVAELAPVALVLTPCHLLARVGSTREILGDFPFLRQMNLASRRTKPFFIDAKSNAQV